MKGKNEMNFWTEEWIISRFCEDLFKIKFERNDLNINFKTFITLENMKEANSWKL